MVQRGKLPRRKRPVDLELFGRSLVKSESDQGILEYLKKKGLSSMRDIKKKFSDSDGRAILCPQSTGEFHNSKRQNS